MTNGRLGLGGGGSVGDFAKVRMILLTGTSAHLGRRMAIAILFLGTRTVRLVVIVVTGGFCRRHDVERAGDEESEERKKSLVGYGIE